MDNASKGSCMPKCKKTCADEHDNYDGRRLLAADLEPEEGQDRQLRPHYDRQDMCAVYYPMRSHDKGISLIFNQEHFEDDQYLNDRAGTEVDYKRCQEVFKKLGFYIIPHNDLTKEQVLAQLALVAGMNHSSHDCMVVIFLSHGKPNVIYAKDKAIAVKKLFEPFSESKCPDLAGKPKIFFIQACRGNKVDKGRRIHYGDDLHPPFFTNDSSASDSPVLGDGMEDSPDDTFSLNVADSDHVTKGEKQGLLPSLDAYPEEMVPTSSWPSADEDTPTESPSLSTTSSVVNSVGSDDEVFEITPGNLEEHYFIFWSTIPGYESYRNKYTGSWFIESLMNFLEREGRRLDLVTVATLVTGEVARNWPRYRPCPKSCLKRKQSCWMLSTTSKFFHFDPPQL